MKFKLYFIKIKFGLVMQGVVLRFQQLQTIIKKVIQLEQVK